MESGQPSWIAKLIFGGLRTPFFETLTFEANMAMRFSPRRLSAGSTLFLEPAKQAVLEEKKRLDESGVVHQDAAIRSARGASLLQRLTIHIARFEHTRQTAAAARRL